MRPQLLVLDVHGREYDATRVSLVRDGTGYALCMEVGGYVETVECQSIASVAVVGMGDEAGKAGSDVGPWGQRIEEGQPQAMTAAELGAMMEAGLRDGSLRLVAAGEAEPVAVGVVR